MEVTSENLVAICTGKLPCVCEMMHPGISCIPRWFLGLLHGFKFGMKFYFPLHFMPLLFRYKQVLKKPFETIMTALKGCIRSTMVLAVMVFIGNITVCSYLRTLHRADSPLMLAVSTLVPLAAFIETPARISEMAMYVMPRFFDAIWKFLKRRGLMADLPYGQVVLFCAATSAIMYSNYKEPDNIKPMYRKACEKFFGEN